MPTRYTSHKHKSTQQPQNETFPRSQLAPHRALFYGVADLAVFRWETTRPWNLSKDDAVFCTTPTRSMSFEVALFELRSSVSE